MLSGRLAKCAILLASFDIKFIPQKTVKGQALADFLAAHLCLDNEELPDDLPDNEVMLVEIKTYQLYIDGEVRSRGARVGIVFVIPLGGLILIHSLSSRSIQIMWLNIGHSSLASIGP